MVTITETVERKLDTPEAIVEHLCARHKAMADVAPFEVGDPVRFASRAGIGPDVGAGDVAVVLWVPPSGNWAHILTLTPGGGEIVVQVPTESLAKFEAQK